MPTIFWILTGFLAWPIIGAAVMTAIDDKNQSLYKWYADCPEQIAWFAQPLTLFCWPVVLGFWLKLKGWPNE